MRLIVNLALKDVIKNSPMSEKPYVILESQKNRKERK